ncbi:hypothetical protein WG66_008713 [Moniliophthora roreri]|nr:hypothetical protein WG66_008713 [Moniliophthora roreri]
MLSRGNAPMQTSYTQARLRVQVDTLFPEARPSGAAFVSPSDVSLPLGSLLGDRADHGQSDGHYSMANTQ